MSVSVKTLKKHTGFSLMELMIVIAIIGLLAAIGIPSYLDYIKKTKVSDLLAVMEAAKSTVVEYYSENNAYPNGSALVSTPQGNVFSALISNNGAIVAQSINLGNGLIVLLSLVPTAPTISSSNPIGVFTWTCGSTDSISSYGPGPSSYAPANCQAKYLSP